ncbi:hypothetical protein LAZ67_13001176 [Cordylochernes scorpioides]|uniref:Integrase catalytic domain-containing protein n=1 Tax=Cordylochernes scorpioides TaxID=51811 RepID=A0ABY6L4G4_9ARAC|nr:hypothetical protein LAZ67_13001176 [Cordylochernes scorpioides]
MENKRDQVAKSSGSEIREKRKAVRRTLVAILVQLAATLQEVKMTRREGTYRTPADGTYSAHSLRRPTGRKMDGDAAAMWPSDLTRHSEELSPTMLDPYTSIKKKPMQTAPSHAATPSRRRTSRAELSELRRKLEYKTIHATQQPHNRKTLRSFLSAVNAYKKFIPDHARLRTPLVNLLKRDVMWVWDEECQKAFTSLKESLTAHPTLHLYQEGLPCQVYCNASTLGIAGVLKQVYPDGKIYTVQNFSRALRAHERNYSMSQLQCLAIGMSKDITQKVKTCPTCQLTKRPLGPTYGELGQPPEAKGPFDLLSLDTTAGFAKYSNTKIYLHVVVDHFSRCTWTFPSKSTSITTYQQVLKRLLQDGSPKRLLTDRAPAFTSPKFNSFLLNRSIHPLLTTSNNPQANGLCERLNATLTGKLRLLHLENPKIAWTKSFLEGSEELDVSDLMRDRIEVLIGADIAGRLLTDDQRRISSGLVAIRTKLGWTVMGKIPPTEVRDDISSLCVTTLLSLDLENLWKIDAIGVSDAEVEKKTQSLQAEMEEHFAHTTTRDIEGRYEVALPWVQDKERIPSTKDLAENQLSSVRRKLEEVGDMNEYGQIFEEWMKQGIIDFQNVEDTEKFVKESTELLSTACFNLRDWDSYVEKTTLHIFCDASQFAYATCIFLRIEKEDRVDIQFIQARTRVAPLKKLTIPRLELLACLIGARLAANVIQDLEFEEIPRFYWADSTNALCWIQREDNWAAFVMNRVKEIHNLSSPESWRHIPGRLNPADLPSRGCSAESLKETRWWEGPAWLKVSQEEWPKSTIIPDLEIVYSERRKTILNTLKTVKKIINQCIRCKRFTVTPATVESTSLPEDRVRDAAVFEIVGVDLTGHLILKNKKKAWIVIFTYLDLIDNQTLSRKYQYIKRVREDLRERFRIEYFGFLRQETRRLKTTIPFKVGDMVLIGQESLKRLHWPLARIIQLYPGKDGLVRVAKVKTSSGDKIRPIQKLYNLEITPEIRCRDPLTERSPTQEVRLTTEEDPLTSQQEQHHIDTPNVVSSYGRPIKRPQPIGSTELFLSMFESSRRQLKGGRNVGKEDVRSSQWEAGGSGYGDAAAKMRKQ